MIKQKIEKIKKHLKELQEKNKRFIPISHFINWDVTEYYEYNKVRYETLEELKRINKITDDDDVLIINIKYV